MAMPRPAPRVAPATRAILPCSTLFGSCFGARVIPIHQRHMIANMREFRASNWNAGGREREINDQIRGRPTIQSKVKSSGRGFRLSRGGGGESGSYP